MGEATNQIERQIQRERDHLGFNLQELEEKVKSVTDWRQQFTKNPMTMVGVAFGGGLMLATMMNGKKRKRYPHSESPSIGQAPHSATDGESRKALETWDNIKGALIGVAATRFKDFVGEVVPGFHEHFEKIEGL